MTCGGCADGAAQVSGDESAGQQGPELISTVGASMMTSIAVLHVSGTYYDMHVDIGLPIWNSWQVGTLNA